MADGTLVLDHRRAAHGAGVGHLVLAGVDGALVQDRPDHLGDHVARLLEHHGVADPDVLAADLGQVVERGPGHRGAGDLRGPQVRDGREGPGPADVGDDVLDQGLHLLRRELERDRPARGAADHAQAGLLVEAVHLDHDAVRLVGQVVAGLAPPLGERR